MRSHNNWLYGVAMVAALLTAPAFARGGGHGGGGHMGGGGHVGGGAHFSGGHVAGHFAGGHFGVAPRVGVGHYWGRPWVGHGGYYGAWRWGPRIGFAFGTPAWYGGHWYHGWIGGTLGWWWGVGPDWYWYDAPVYPYPTVAPTVAAPEDTQPMLYYCPGTRAYYPNVQNCDGGWQQVAAPPAPAPQQQTYIPQQRYAPQPRYVPQPAPAPQYAPAPQQAPAPQYAPAPQQPEPREPLPAPDEPL